MQFKGIVGLFLLATLLVASSIVFAKEDMEDKGKKLSPLGEFALAESVFLVSAGIAASYPKGYGTVLAVSSPLIAITDKDLSMSGYAINLMALESLAIYNISVLDKDKYSKSEKFRQNVIGFHIVGAILLATKYFFKDIRINSKFSYSVFPATDGGFAQVSYRF